MPHADETAAPPIRRRRFAWPVFVVLAALVVAVAILTLLRVRPPAPPPARVALVDLEGRQVELAALRGTLVVIALGDAGETDFRRRLQSLWSELSPAVELISLEFDEGPALAGDESWTRARGGRDALIDLALAHLGFDRAEVDAWLAGDLAGLLVSVDRMGRAHARYHVTGGGEIRGSGDGPVSDMEFLARLARRPRLHAMLNGTSALLLVCGFLMIRRGWVRPHLACMLSAGLITTLFLASYVYYHYYAGSVPFKGHGWVRPLYFGILLSHTVLAALVVPLVGTLLVHAARSNFGRHRKLARWALPIWLYVSVTGVLIYALLYVWSPVR